MQIDWLTVIAQIVNFLILVWLLKRFLYQPVIAAMDRREQRIAHRLQEAAAREQAAEQEAALYREKNATFERQRDELLSAAVREVEERRKSMLEEARVAVDATQATWQAEVERERQEFLGTFKQQAAAALIRTARRVLADLAEGELEQQLIRSFVKRLEAMDHGQLAALRKSAHKASEIRVTTSFEADPDTRSRIKRAIEHHLLEGRELEIQFHHSKDLICGIEVSTDGRKLGWTMADYLQVLEQDLDQALALAHVPEEHGSA